MTDHDARPPARRSPRLAALLLPGLLAVCLPAPGPVLAQGTAAQPAAPPPEPATLVVRGTATVDRKPDVARLAIALVTRGATAEGVARDHEARVARAAAVLGRLKAQGVSVDQGAFDLGEDEVPASPGAPPPRPTYRAETVYDLSMPGPDRLDAVVGDIAAAGLFEVQSARFAVAETAGALDEVRRAAMADARRQATVYAEAGDLRLDGILRIADGDAGGGEGGFERPLRLARAKSVGIRPPDRLQFQGSVTVTWRVVPR